MRDLGALDEARAAEAEVAKRDRRLITMRAALDGIEDEPREGSTG